MITWPYESFQSAGVTVTPRWRHGGAIWPIFKRKYLVNYTSENAFGMWSFGITFFRTNKTCFFFSRYRSHLKRMFPVISDVMMTSPTWWSVTISQQHDTPDKKKRSPRDGGEFPRAGKKKSRKIIVIVVNYWHGRAIGDSNHHHHRQHKNEQTTTTTNIEIISTVNFNTTKRERE